MNAATVLFQRLAASRLVVRPGPVVGMWKVIAWWEIRRFLYNFVVGVTGAAVCALMLGCALVCERVLGEPIGFPDPPLFVVFAVLFYAAVANVCYTGGWVAELIVRVVWQERSSHFGEISFTLGLVFSVLLTCLPVFLVLPIAAVRLAGHFLPIVH